jgi:hypothetical protein
MWDFFSKLVERVPARLAALLLALTVGTSLVWFVALAGAALFTNRAVEFFPPKIGTDPALQAEIKALHEQLRESIQNEQSLRVTLIGQSIAVREQSAQARQKGEDRAADAYKENADQLDLQIRRSEELLARQLSEFGPRLDSLQRRL